MNDVQLKEEVEGSKRDVLSGCQSVDIEYIHQRADWMNESPIQAIFTIKVSPPPPATSPAAHTYHIAACMPKGYMILTQTFDKSYAQPTPARYYPTLNAALLHISPDYKSNRDSELSRRLNDLSKLEEKEDENVDKKLDEDIITSKD